jgi:hypothetical protein
MNLDELEILMNLVACDRRTTGEMDLKYWALMAHEGRWTLPTAMRAVIIFRNEKPPGEWLDPSHITSIIRDARRKAADTFVVPNEPEGIKNADLPRWHRAQLAAHQDRLLAKWCEGGELPVTPIAAGQITGHAALTSGIDLTTCPEGLKEHVAECVQRAGQLDRHRAAVSLPRGVEDNPDRRAYARAELEAARQKWGEPE